MSDHLDFIRIRGLEDSELEVFQGIASGTTGTGSTPAAAAVAATTAATAESDTGIWDAFVDLITGLNDEFEKAKPTPEPERGMSASGARGSRQLSLPLPSNSGWIVTAVTSLAAISGGPVARIIAYAVENPGATLAVAQAIQAGMEIVDFMEETIDDIATNADRNRLIEVLEKAFLRSEGTWPFDTETSLLGDILKKGLLHLPPDAEDEDDNYVSTLKEGLLELLRDPETNEEFLQSYLARLSEEQWKDLELAFGDDVKLRVKGKTLHF